MKIKRAITKTITSPQKIFRKYYLVLKLFVRLQMESGAKMTDKEKYIINYLIAQNGQAYYIDIRDAVGHDFENEEDFDITLKLLTVKNWIYETDFGSTLFQLNKLSAKTTSQTDLD